MSKQSNFEKENILEHKSALGPVLTETLQHHDHHMKTHLNEKPIKCPECPYKAKRKSAVNKHLKYTHGSQSRPFPCPHSGCNYAAKERSTLKSHSKTHSDEKSLVCSHPNCNYSTNHKNNLVVHIRVHTGEKPHVCQFQSCYFASKTSRELVIHSRTHTKEKPYKCHEPNCEYASAIRSNLQRHQIYRHAREGEQSPSFSCPLCEYSVKTQGHLLQHIKRHTLEKLFKCDEPNCSFEAKTKSDVDRHKFVHSDKKPFACSVESCEFRCKTKVSLSQHLRSHSEEKQYKCELCPFRGKTRSVVTTHIKNIHNDPDFRPFKCKEPNCFHAAKTKGSFQKHVLIHNTEKNYSCSFPNCDYRAVEKNRVKSHEYNIHSEEKKEKCGICLYKCKKKSNLTIHMRTHTKETPYKCKEEGCEYRSASLSHLKRHHKQKHSDDFQNKK